MKEDTPVAKKILKGLVTLIVGVFIVFLIFDNLDDIKNQATAYIDKPAPAREKARDFTDTEEYKEMSEEEQCEYWKDLISRKHIITYDDKVRRDRVCK